VEAIFVLLADAVKVVNCISDFLYRVGVLLGVPVPGHAEINQVF
jgi:hypothetical protein